jgi:phosphatidylserine decarboxylase
MFHREGFKIIAITFIIVGVIALTADTYITQDLIKYGVQGVALAVLVLI